MKLLLVHLSDIHITGEHDAILKRAAQIVAACRSSGADVKACFVAVTGDIAFSGTATQYSHAEVLLREIGDALSQDLGVEVRRVLVPGNHDLDFEVDDPLRQLARSAVLDSTTSQHDRSLVSKVMEPQKDFFGFVDSFSVDGRLERSASPSLHYEYRFEVASGKSVRFLCLNTAWVSQKHEAYGSLAFPPTVIPSELTSDALTIALMHHPYGWLEPISGRALRKTLETHADLILTGHEHDPDSVNVERASGAVVDYLEGGILQDSRDSNTSSFHSVLIDLEKRRKLVRTFAWKGERYLPLKSDEKWEDLATNPLRGNTEFSFSPDHQKRLDDLGVGVIHPTLGTVRFSDLYVFPDLRETIATALTQKGTKVIRSAEVVSFVNRQQGRVFIVGDTESGKTSLAKGLTRALFAEGRGPVLLSGRDKIPIGDDLTKHIEDEMVAQYDNPDRAIYQQLAAAQRVVIVDDYDQVSLNKSRREQLLVQLETIAATVVLIGHEMLVGVAMLPQGDLGTSVSSYRIQSFGYALRNALVQKWLLLADNADADTSGFLRNLNVITKRLDELIGKNFVPAYPPYLISMLQAADAATSLNIQPSTSGYYYELLVRAQLARTGDSVQYDILVTYLAELAFKMFEARERTPGRKAVREWHDDYERRYDQQLPFEETLKSLVNKRIFRLSDDQVQFSYSYIYYYFVASYFRDHIADPSIRDHITRLAHSVHVEENANILLFLAHLSRDEFIISEVLAAAREQYSDVPPAEMDADLAFLSGLHDLEKTIVTYKDSDPKAARAQYLERMDREGEATPDQFNLGDPSNPLVRLGTALKTLQILGQIAKNFPGSIQGDRKAEIVNACFDIGLRCLTWVYRSFAANQKELLQEYADTIGRAHPHYNRDEILDRSERVVHALTAMISYGMVKRVSMAVGSPHLERTYSKLPNPDVPARRLIHISIDLDQNGEFPIADLREAHRLLEKKALARLILCTLATQRIRLFETDYATKQKVCAELEITFEQLESPDQPKLLKR